MEREIGNGNRIREEMQNTKKMTADGVTIRNRK